MAERIRLEDRECPLSTTLGLVGEWWTLLILHDAFDGYTRFDQFQDEPGHLLQHAHQPAEAPGRRRAARTAPVPDQPRPPRVRADRTRPLPPAGDRRPGRVGQRPPGAEERSMVLVDAETGVEAEPVLVDRAPADASTDRTSSSPPVPLRASLFGTATRGDPPRQLSRITRDSA